MSRAPLKEPLLHLGKTFFDKFLHFMCYLGLNFIKHKVLHVFVMY